MLYIYSKNKLAFKRVNIFKYVVILLALLILLSSFLYKEKLIYVKSEKEIHLTTDRDFSEARLIQEIKKYNFKYSEIILAQAILESGNYESLVFKNNNNLFGLRQAKSRNTTAQRTELNHAKYSDWQSSVSDRALFEAAYLRKIKNEEQYYQYLDANYAEAGNYSNSLKDIIKRNKIKDKFR